VIETAAAMALGMREGHLLYVSSTGELYAVPFDLDRQRTTGDPVRLESGIRILQPGAALASLSVTGSLWYVAGPSMGHLVHVGNGRPEARLFEEKRSFRDPRFSPDGRKVAVEVTGTNGSNIWVYDVANHTFTPLTTDDGSTNVEWTSDSKRVLYRSVREGKQGIWWQPADGSGGAELLYQPEEVFNESGLSPDGRWVVYRTAPGPHPRDIFGVPLTGDRKPVLLVGGPSQESHPRISPDGKWLVYQSSESGRYEVYVRPFPNAGARVQVSSEGGAEPLWSRSGTTIFYRSLTGGVESANLNVGTTIAVTARREMLPPADYLTDVTHASYDVWPDGSGFLMVKPIGGDTRPVLVHNWGRELRERLAAAKR
jgi:serine/threonine-protein kinase